MSNQRPKIPPGVLVALDQLVVSASNFFTLLIVARRVSTDDFSMFSLAMTATLLLAAFHRALFTQPINLYGAFESKAALCARTSALMKGHLIAIPTAAALLFIFSIFWFPDRILMLACGTYLGSFFLQETLRRHLYTQGSLIAVIVNDTVCYGGRLLVLLVVGLIWPISAHNAFMIMIITTSAALLLGSRQVAFPRQMPPRSFISVLAQHWAMSKWLLLTVLVGWCAVWCYPLLISPLGTGAVASFSACQNLLNVLNAVALAIGNYLPLYATRLLKEQNKSALREHMVKFLVSLSVTALLFLLLMLFWGDVIMHLAYHGRYDHAVQLLPLLSWGALCGLMGSVLGAYSLAMEDSRASFLSNLGANVFTFTAGIWLIHAYGLGGAALAAAISPSITMLLQGALVVLRWKQLPTYSQA